MKKTDQRLTVIFQCPTIYRHEEEPLYFLLTVYRHSKTVLMTLDFVLTQVSRFLEKQKIENETKYFVFKEATISANEFLFLATKTESI